MRRRPRRLSAGARSYEGFPERHGGSAYSSSGGPGRIFLPLNMAETRLTPVAISAWITATICSAARPSRIKKVQ